MPAHDSIYSDLETADLLNDYVRQECDITAALDALLRRQLLVQR